MQRILARPRHRKAMVGWARVVAILVGVRGMFNVIHKDYLIKVDCILGKDSEFQKSAFKRRKQVRIEGHSVWLISPEDLILAKLLWAQESLSELQLNDVKHVLERKDLDRDYLNRWITKLGLVNLYEKVSHA